MIAASKAELRSELRGRRRALALSLPDAAERAASVLASSALKAFATAAVYRPIGAELDCQPVAQVLQARGAAIALPVVVRAGWPLIFRLRAHAALAPDALGLHAPDQAAGEVRPDLVIAPLLAFDGAGGRLGQGGGFYDRTLQQLRSYGPVVVLGLAYAGQEVEEVPMGPFDQKLDGVLTERGLRWFRGVF